MAVAATHARNPDKCRVFVRGVNLSFTSAQEVAVFFSEKGRVKEVITKHQPPGALVVEFQNALEAVRALALDGEVMHTISQDSMQLTVRPYSQKKQPDVIENARKCFVSKLDRSCSREELTAFMRHAGVVVDVDLLPANSTIRGQCAIVTYASVAGAERALESLHGAMFVPEAPHAFKRRVCVEAYRPTPSRDIAAFGPAGAASVTFAAPAAAIFAASAAAPAAAPAATTAADAHKHTPGALRAFQVEVAAMLRANAADGGRGVPLGGLLARHMRYYSLPQQRSLDELSRIAEVRPKLREVIASLPALRLVPWEDGPNKGEMLVINAAETAPGKSPEAAPEIAALFSARALERPGVMRPSETTSPRQGVAPAAQRLHAIAEAAATALVAHGGPMLVTDLVMKLKAIEPNVCELVRSVGGAKRFFGSHSACTTMLTVYLPKASKAGSEVIALQPHPPPALPPPAAPPPKALQLPPTQANLPPPLRGTQHGGASSAPAARAAGAAGAACSNARNSAVGGVGGIAAGGGAGSGECALAILAEAEARLDSAAARLGGTSQQGTLKEKVERIMGALELDPSLSLMAAVREANAIMGVQAPRGTLPEQVADLLAQLGV